MDKQKPPHEILVGDKWVFASRPNKIYTAISIYQDYGGYAGKRVNLQCDKDASSYSLYFLKDCEKMGWGQWIPPTSIQFILESEKETPYE